MECHGGGWHGGCPQPHPPAPGHALLPGRCAPPSATTTRTIIITITITIIITIISIVIVVIIITVITMVTVVITVVITMIMVQIIIIMTIIMMNTGVPADARYLLGVPLYDRSFHTL